MTGQNILQLPYHHPVRLAEDLVTIDILSNGRVAPQAGQAGAPFDDEFRALGLNPKQRPSRTEEGMDMVRKCWTEEVFSYEGRHWQLQDVRVYPKPLQKPHPPMYLVAQTDASTGRAARMGFHACGQGGSGPTAALGDKAVWQAWLRRWHAALAKYGRKPEDFKTNTFGTCFITGAPEKVWAKHEAILYTAAYRRFNGIQP
jgi:alkanesulfonate monooxygenase SsuD/methylene tetrahydromethanopterin reductase-like flavin-dependent oxidoreductase (luciferase family)